MELQEKCGRSMSNDIVFDLEIVFFFHGEKQMRMKNVRLWSA